jgi:protein-disulfide isomerase
MRMRPSLSVLVLAALTTAGCGQGQGAGGAGTASAPPPGGQAPPAAPAPAAPPSAADALAGGSLTGDAWRSATELPGVDFSSLTAAEKLDALTILREEGCPCGCGMMLAQCRIHDPNCPLSPGLAAQVVKAIADGKSMAAVKAELEAAAPPPRPEQPAMPQEATLGEKVDIPIDGAPFKGPASARVTIVEFSDFQCPYCSQATAWADSILAAYPQDVKLVFKQFPLPFHPQARLAAEASLAAHAQGKFWQLHDKMFASYKSIDRSNILAWAREVGIDADRLAKEIDAGKYKAAVDADMRHAEKAGVQGTPSFYFNGRPYEGGRDLAAVKSLIDAELRKGS